MTTTQGRNEAAERLRSQLADADPSQTLIERWLLDEALTAERRATVERIRSHFVDIDPLAETWPDLVFEVLDEEAAR